MNKSRRGFFGNLLFAGVGMVSGIEASEPTTQYNQPLPIENPIFTSSLRYDEIFADLKTVVSDQVKRRYIWENDNISIDIHTFSDGTQYRRINPKKPMGLQDLYSALKDLWFKNLDVVKFSYPMVAITPEQFMMEDGWDIDTTFLRSAGIKLSNGEEYACITICSQEGIVTVNGYKIPNSGLVPIQDGKLVGRFKKYEEKMDTTLDPFTRNLIGGDNHKFTFQQYRII